MAGDALIADTPGFSSLDLRQLGVLAQELQEGFMEFDSLIDRCRFAGCTHRSEPDCAVCQAVESGEIHPSRYRSYLSLYENLKDLREWQHKM